jgi:hypothetical protein
MDDVCHCGCCESANTLPFARHQAPGAPAVEYRAGTHATFKAALLARVSSADAPALAGLRTRRDDDFTIATCDAVATLLDVLTFYQERYANEFYLRTASERRSLVDLSRLIGYRPSPGVAAGTHLAFLLEQAPGAPSLAAEPVTIAAGTRVQSVPGPGEEPQTFETVQAVTARVEWNAIPVQTTERQTFAIGTTDLFITGVVVPLQPGDVMVVVGDERLADTTNLNWSARVIDAVERDNDRGVTQVRLSSGLGQVSPPIDPPLANPRAYVFRQRAALFGHNAPDPRFMTVPDGFADADGNWTGYEIQGTRIDLDASYPKILAGSWLLLAGGDGVTGLPELPGLLELCRVNVVQHLSRSAFALSGRLTAITPDATANLASFPLTGTVAFAQSEEVPLAERRVGYPLYGTELPLSRVSTHLKPEQAIAVSGRRQRVRIVVEDDTLQFVPDGGDPVPLAPGDSFAVAAPPMEIGGGAEVVIPPPDLASVLLAGAASLRWRLIDRDGRLGTVDAVASAVRLQSALSDDPIVRELSTVAGGDSAVQHDRDRTTLQLDAPLVHVYDRATATVCANVAPATHGETVSEVAGSGHAATPGQRFLLKQSPLTYIGAPTPDGRASTLDVRVDGLSWREVSTLFGHGADARVYALRQDGDGNTIVQFGDGLEGSRLPSGRDNVRFRYRKFIGRGGNLDAGRLTTLLGRPLGVKSVANVTPASGGEDAESLRDARRNAPLTTLTLGRAVSIQDYTDFSRTFAGIAKAHAVWRGAGRGVFVTVAGPDGAAVDANSQAMANLTRALREYGDERMPLTVKSYAPVSFRVAATIAVAGDADADEVVEAVESALRAHYGFDARDFAQVVSVDEVVAVMHEVTGVEGVDVNALYRADPGALPSLTARLWAFPAQVQNDGTMTPAEILTLDEGPLQLGVMS